MRAVFSSREQWASYWQANHSARCGTNTPFADLDFRRDMLFVIALPPKTALVGLKAAVRDSGIHQSIELTLERAGERCYSGDPDPGRMFAFRFSRRNGVLLFRDREIIRDCD